MTTNKELFTKEQYLKIKAAWKQAVNDERAKDYFDEGMYFNPITRSAEPTTVRCSGWINGEHHLLYNLIRGKQPHTGFTLISNSNKLANGVYLNNGYVEAAYQLTRIVKFATELTNDDQTHRHEFKQKHVNTFLEPFGDSLTVEDLSQLHVPEYAAVESNFGPGIVITKAIKKFGLSYIPFEVISMTRSELVDFSAQIKEDVLNDDP